MPVHRTSTVTEKTKSRKGKAKKLMAADIVTLIALTYCVSLSEVMVTEYLISFIQDLNKKKYVSNRTNPSMTN